MQTQGYERLGAEAIAKSLSDVLGEDAIFTLARETGWLKRAWKIAPVAWVAATISTLGSGKADWLADIWRTLQAFSGQTIFYKPFHKQLAKPEFAEMFRALFERALTRWSRPVLAANSKLRRFKDIVLHDGTSFALKDSLAGQWPGRFTTVSPAAVELHVTMSLLEDGVHSVTLTADSESERAHKPTAAALHQRLFLGDRGYEERQFFLDVNNAGGFFIVRGNKAIRPHIVRARNAAGRVLPKLAGHRLSWDILPAETVDLDIEWAISAKVVYRGRIVALFRKGLRNEASFTVLHTNLARAEFSALDVGEIYRLRWQVELLFKECKSHANLHAFDTQNGAIAEGLIWASLLAAFLKRSVTHMAARIHGVELSTQRAAASAKHFLDPIMRAILHGLACLQSAAQTASAFLAHHAKRAHPQRDRKNGRLRMGFCFI
jgi:Transposase DDE domain